MISSKLKTKHGSLVILGLVIAFFGSLGLDQVTKQHAQNALIHWEDPLDDDRYYGKGVPLARLGGEPGTESPYISLGWQYSRNKGAAFSMFATLADHIREPLFHAITLLAAIMIYFYLKTTPWHHTFTRYGLVMIFSGAIGNFVDRMHRGYVVDFIDVDWRIFGWEHDFAIFNVADMAINLGVICLIIDMILHRKEFAEAKTKTSET